MQVSTVIDSMLLQCLWIIAMSLNEKKKPLAPQHPTKQQVWFLSLSI